MIRRHDAANAEIAQRFSQEEQRIPLRARYVRRAAVVKDLTHPCCWVLSPLQTKP